MSTEQGTTRVLTAEAGDYFPAIETHLLQSRHVSQMFRIQVMQPLRKSGQLCRCPVVYATDGNLAFDVLKGISYGIQTSGQTVPQFILVGIGYPEDSPIAGALLRVRDLTFPQHPRLNTKPGSLRGVLVAREGAKDFGGAEDFQQFIGEELVPFIDERYLTAAGDRTYFGHSAGGGFGLFTLFTRPELFRRYIISSPGISCNGETSAGITYENYDFMLREARKFVASGPALRDTPVYMSVGGEEEFEPELAKWHLTSSFLQMASLLKTAAVPGLKLMTEIFPAETHMTVWPMAFIHGVQAVFGTGVWTRGSRDRIAG
jgi:uncharacterized protein